MKTIYIHRGRNKKSVEIGKLFTNLDYNFDYRGSNPLTLIIKAFLTSTEIPKADIYFVEGGLCLNVAYFVKKRKAPKSKIILMVPEPLFDLKNKSKFKKWWIKRMVSQVDGVMAVSEMVAEDSRQVYEGPVELGHHYAIDIEKYAKIKSDSESKRIAFVCERPNETGKTKGLDIVIEAFRIIKEKEPKAELLLVGAGTDEVNYNIEGIKYLGFKQMTGVYEDISVIISPGRYDAFPIVIIEASCARVAPFISDKVGSKEFVAKANKDLVLNSLDPKEYAERILEWWKKPKSEKQETLKKLKKFASYYNKENCLNEFKNAWEKFLNE